MVQVIKCRHGKIFAACTTPEYFEDVDWQREMRKYVKGGCTVEMAESGTWSFEKCECSKTKKSEEKIIQPALF